MCILSELFHVQAPSVGIGEAVTIQAWPTSVPALTFPSAVRTCSQSLWMLPLSFHSVRPPAWAAGARNTIEKNRRTHCTQPRIWPKVERRHENDIMHCALVDDNYKRGLHEIALRAGRHCVVASLPALRGHPSLDKAPRRACIWKSSERPRWLSLNASMLRRALRTAWKHDPRPTINANTQTSMWPTSDRSSLPASPQNRFTVDGKLV